MHPLIMMAMAQAVTTVAPQPAPLPIPMSPSAWSAMGQVEKLQYADVTIQGLRRNPVLAGCQALTPAALASGIDTSAKTGQPLMMTVAAIAYGLCG